MSEAMTVVESIVKLGQGNDKLGSSKSEERGVCEMDHKEDSVDGNGNGDNGGNGKPRVGKKKPNKKKGQDQILSLRRSTFVEEMSEG